MIRFVVLDLLLDEKLDDRGLGLAVGRRPGLEVVLRRLGRDKNGFLESILRNRFDQNLRTEPDWVKSKLIILTFYSF
jgi:hypothetical protein